MTDVFAVPLRSFLRLRDAQNSRVCIWERGIKTLEEGEKGICMALTIL